MLQPKLWDNYAAAWSTEDRTTRNTILQKHLAPEVRYTDPEVQTSGYEEISEYMKGFQSDYPGRHFVISGVIAHHGSCLAHWTMRNEKNEIELTGTSFAEISSDGRLSRICGFFGKPAAHATRA